MAEMSGKTYNETAALGASVDLTDDRDIENVRAARQDGTLGETEEENTSGGGLADGAFQLRDDIAATASELYEEAGNFVRHRRGEVMSELRMKANTMVENRPVQLFMGAALVGFLFGKFG